MTATQIETVNSLSGEKSTRLLTTQDLADRWGMSEQTIRIKRSQGADLPPFIRVGGKFVRYSLEAVEAWELAHTEQAG